jgi:predicted phage terminase large subunit-like protein
MIERDGEKFEVNLRLCVDPAATCTKDADFTAIGVGGKDKDGYLYILDLKLLRLTSDKWIKEMYDLLDKWNLKTLHLETVGFAEELKTTIKNKFNTYYPVSIRDYKPTNKTSKKERIESGLEPLMSNGMLFMSTFLGGMETLVDQFNFFPAETEKDDGLDVIQMLNEVCIKSGSNRNNVVPINKNVNKIWGGMR